MDAKVETVYKKLTDTLLDMTKIYRQLLELVRREKDCLIQVNAEQINSTRIAKEELINKARIADLLREKHAQGLGALLGLASPRPRLMELAARMPLKEGDILRQLHSSLELLIKRIHSVNRENEIYAQSALKALNGALGNIKETLAGKNTYERRGQYKTGPEVSGNFVSKEA